MFRVYLTFFTLMLYGLCFGQLVLTPLYLDQPSTYNPAAAGKFVDEFVQLSTLSFYEKSVISSPTPFRSNNSIFVNPSILILNENKRSTALQASEIYFLSYQKTITLNNQARFSIGVQVQAREDYIPKFSTPQSVGFTLAIHKTLDQKGAIQKIISLGFQSNYTKDVVNLQVAERLYTEPLLEWTESFEEFLQNFSKSRLNLVLGADWTVIKRDKFMHNFALAQKVDYRNLVTLNSNENSNPFSLNSNFQLSGTFTVFYNFQIITRDRKGHFEYSILIGPEPAMSLGYGRRLASGNIWRLSASLTGHLFNFADIGAKFSYQTKQYNISLFIGNRNLPKNDIVAQLGVGYNLQATGNPSLFRLN